MILDSSCKRKEARFSISAETIISVSRNGEILQASSTNMSGGGVLLHFAESAPRLAVGDDLICEYTMPEDAPVSLPRWTIGKVVRVDQNSAALHFAGGVFSPPEPKASTSDTDLESDSSSKTS